MAMQTARNKWRNNKEEKNESNEMYDLLEIINDLKIYKYSNKKRICKHKFIYQYYYDKFEENDYKKAYIILFIGKTGDGKTTAINAFFNIVKGIDINNKKRFILIKEQKKPKGQAESQTDGLHLYYLRDSNNYPLIIIDSQGFGDTRGIEYDELINKAFEYAFTNIIDHINIICFISKASESRLDKSIKYIFSCATGLFSDDICRSFIILNTHADRSTMKEGPQFVKSIKTKTKFKEIFEKIDNKFWYSVDSTGFFDDDVNDKLNKYSFKQLKELYEEKVKNWRNYNLHRSSEIIKCRNEIKNKIKDIISNSKNLISKKRELPDIENKINDYNNKINNIDYRINNKRNEIDCVYVPNIDYQLSELERERDKRIFDLENEYEEKTFRKFDKVGGERTLCYECEQNCHDPCDCFGSLVERCTIFPILEIIVKDVAILKQSIVFILVINIMMKRQNIKKIIF